MPLPPDRDAFLKHGRAGNEAFQAGRFDAAEREYREAARIEPSSAEARADLGRALAKLGRVDEAIAEFQAALRTDPEHESSLSHLALCQERQGQWGPALRTYERMLQTSSGEALRHTEKRISELKLRLSQTPQTRTLGPETRTLAPGLPTAGSEVPGSSAWRIGETVNGLYEVNSLLGEGGFGSVHKVNHLGWHMELAVKSPREDRVSSRRAMERFVAEANTWVGLGLHPHIVTCYFVRVIGGIPRIFIEYLEGGTLAEWLSSRGQVDVKAAVDLAIQAARAMELGQSRGLVHRDLKPGNCMMTPAGTLKVTDFGLAKVDGDGEAGEAAAGGAGPEAGVKLARAREATATGRLGTPEYMAPEQWYQAGHATGAADTWAFGVMLHELLWARRPFEIGDGEPLDAFYARMLEGNWAYKLPDGVPSGLRDVVSACLDPDPKRREARFSVLRARLEALYSELFREPYPREAVKETPLLADTLSNQGVSLADLGRTEDALKLFSAAIKQDPTHPGAVYNEGVLLLKEGRLSREDFLGRLAATRKARATEWVPAYLSGLARLAGGDKENGIRELLEADALSHYPLIKEALGKAGSDKTESLLDLFVSLPMGSEAASMGEALFSSLLARASKEAQARRLEQAYQTLLTARGVKGYERAPAALDLQRGIGSLGVRRGLRGGWARRVLGGQGPALSAAVSPDGKRALSGHENNTAALWDLEDGSLLRVFTGHAKAVRTTAFLPNGRLALSSGADGCVRFWNPSAETCVRAIPSKGAAVNSVCPAPNSLSLLTGDEEGTIRVFDAGTGKETESFDAHEGPVLALRPSLDGTQVVSVGKDKALKRWGIRKGKALLSIVQPKAVCSMDFSLDGSVLLGCEDGRLRLIAPSLQARDLTGHLGPVRSVSFAPEGRFALSGADDGSVKVWDTVQGSCLWTFEGHQGAVAAVSFTPDARLAVSAGKDGVRLWELDWDHSFPEPRNWDDGAVPAIESYLLRRGPERPASKWTEADFQGVMDELGRRGFGWLRLEGVKPRLNAIHRRVRAREASARFRIGPLEIAIFVALALVAAYIFTPARKGKVDEKAVAAALQAARDAAAKEMPKAPKASLTQVADRNAAPAALPPAERPTTAPNSMAPIPAGEFWMGSVPDEGQAEERPRHRVHLDAFSLDRYEVTVAQFRRFLQSSGNLTQDRYLQGGDDSPAESVSWNDAAAYCAWAGKRLPTEAEWEKAARGGSDAIYHFGDFADLDGYAWTQRNSAKSAHPVGLKTPNQYGLYDMYGNASEWVSDWYGEHYYDHSPARNPQGPGGGVERVQRGGSRWFPAEACRSAARFRISQKYSSGGFRCAVTGRPPEGAVSPGAPARPGAAGVPEDMVLIPAGQFQMGASDSRTAQPANPLHAVHLSPYLIETHEVTNAEYEKCVEARGCRRIDYRDCRLFDLGGVESPRVTGPVGGADHPAMCLNWAEAKAFCEWSGRRLPTEAEWEKAARGGTNGDYGHGYGGQLGDYSWTITNSGRQPQPVGRKKPNPYGLHDATGNLWEWVSDRYRQNYTGPASDPRGPEDGDYRVAKGCGFFNDAEECRVAIRARVSPVSRTGMGARCAADAPSSGAALKGQSAGAGAPSAALGGQVPAGPSSLPGAHVIGSTGWSIRVPEGFGPAPMFFSFGEEGNKRWQRVTRPRQQQLRSVTFGRNQNSAGAKWEEPGPDFTENISLDVRRPAPWQPGTPWDTESGCRDAGSSAGGDTMFPSGRPEAGSRRGKPSFRYFCARSSKDPVTGAGRAVEVYDLLIAPDRLIRLVYSTAISGTVRRQDLLAGKRWVTLEGADLKGFHGMQDSLAFSGSESPQEGTPPGEGQPGTPAPKQELEAVPLLR